MGNAHEILFAIVLYLKDTNINPGVGDQCTVHEFVQAQLFLVRMNLQLLKA